MDPHMIDVLQPGAELGVEFFQRSRGVARQAQRACRSPPGWCEKPFVNAIPIHAALYIPIQVYGSNASLHPKNQDYGSRHEHRHLLHGIGV